MKHNRKTYVKNILFPCLLVSSLAGALTGGLIFLFKLVSARVIHLSAQLYALVRSEPRYLPLLMAGGLAAGLVVTAILRYEPSARGGGIPTAMALLRSLITFRWLRTLMAVFVSAMLTYLVGVPLGNEGPSVQMGTAVGCGTTRLFGKKNRAWSRYVMTGGASAGFACATGAPITGILFAFEEAHRRFSPMLFMAAASATVSGYAVTDLLCDRTGLSMRLFDLSIREVLPLRHMWAPMVVGLVAGLLAIAFTKLYQWVADRVHGPLASLSDFIKIPVLFLLVTAVGFASAQLIGTGHDLVEQLLHGHAVWYLLLLCLAVRGILLILANNLGVTGGLFLPSLALGGLLGALCAHCLVSLGWLSQDYYLLLVCVGMAAFLAASSRTPVMAIVFAVEVLGCIFNLLPVVVGVTFASLVIETARVTSFTDTVIHNRVETENAGKTPTLVEDDMTVAEDAFVVDKEISDVLWPPTCTILSVSKNRVYSSHADGGLHPGDVLHLHYISYDLAQTKEQLEALIGPQPTE